MARRLHLAYGQTLDTPSRHAIAVGHAFLPDRALAFIDGGLDIVERPGHVVEGIVFDVDPHAGWKPLDLKYGHPESCERFDGEALHADGTSVPVRAYALRSHNVDAIRRAYCAHAMHLAPLDAAFERRPPQSLVPSLFVYGTLMRGESRHTSVLRHSPQSVLPATCRGRLVDLGDYPGMLPAGDDAPATVLGELVRFGDESLIAAVRRIDAIEGFRGFGADGSLYIRRLVRVTLGDGAVHLAWTYLYAGDAGLARWIPSGAWRP